MAAAPHLQPVRSRGRGDGRAAPDRTGTVEPADPRDRHGHRLPPARAPGFRGREGVRVMALLAEKSTITDWLTADLLLGEGAYAEVYRVRHAFLGWQALKLFKRVA